MSTTANLAALPLELFEQIAEYIPAELLTLRLVSRDTVAKSQRVFAQAYFAHKAFMLNVRPSLEAALKIAQHPAFGPALRKITLYGHESNSIEASAPGNPASVNGGLLEKSKGLQADHDAMHNSKEDVEMLSAMFKELQKHGKMSELIVSAHFDEDDVDSISPVLGGTDLGEFPFSRIFINKDSSMPLLLQKAFTALSDSRNTTITSLVMKKSTFDLGGISTDEFSAWSPGLANLKYVSLCTTFGQTNPFRSNRQDKPQISNPSAPSQFMQLLTSAPSLESLRLGINSENFGMMHAFLQSTFPTLLKLEIYGLRSTSKNLVDFINKQPRLASLVLWDYMIARPIAELLAESLQDSILRQTKLVEVDIVEYDLEAESEAATAAALTARLNRPLQPQGQGQGPAAE